MTITDMGTFAQEWEVWHRQHETARADPHGFLAITGLHWLTGEPQRFPDAPGEWWTGPDGVTVRLAEGEAHVIRNAGGVVTADEIRSLAISQRLLGTTEIVLVHHTDCGMLTFSDEEFRSSIEQEVGERPEWHSEAFTDLEDDVRASRKRILDSPYIPHKESVRGFVFDVATGRLTEVD